MAKKIKILGFAGCLRQGSYNKLLLKAAASLTPAGAEMELFDVKDIPLFNQDLENNLPAAVREFKNKVKAADAILIVTPEYNYSIPGVTKNALDWASRPYGDNSWADKPVAIAGASAGGFGTVRAQLHLRQCFIFLNMHPLSQPEFYLSKAQDKFDDKGDLTDPEDKARLTKLLKALVDWTIKLKK